MHQEKKIILQNISDVYSSDQIFVNHLTSMQFQKIFKEINHGFVVLDSNKRIIFANNAFYHILKLPIAKSDRLIGKKIFSLCSHKSKVFFNNYIAGLLGNGSSWIGEIDLINSEKNVIKTSFEIIPATSVKDHASYYICWISLLSATKVVFCPTLEETIVFFKSLFELAPEPICLIDVTGRILSANKSLEKSTGYSSHELLKKNICNLEGTCFFQHKMAMLFAKQSRKKELFFSGKLIDCDGERHPVDITMQKAVLCGTQAALVYLQDVSLQNKYQHEARANLELRNLLTRITKRFSLINVNSFDKAANEALGDLGRFSKVDRCYLFKIEDNKLYITNTHEWCSRFASSEIQRLQHVLLKPYMWLLKHIQHFHYFAIDRVEDLPESMAEAKKEFMHEKIKSMLIVPLMRGNRVFGSVGFDAVAHHVKWSPIIIQLLTDFSNFIAQALDRRDALILQEQKKKLELLLTQKLLSATEDELAFFIKYVPTPIAILDKRLCYQAVSDRWRQEFGVSTSAVIGKRFSEIFKFDRVKWEKIYHECLNGKTLADDQDSFIRPDGKREWIKWKAYPRKDQDDRISGVIVLSEVITERIAHEEKVFRMMHYDFLTEVPNRLYFQEYLTDIVEKHRGQKYVLIAFLIDNLEVINNYYNIFIGDLFIKAVIKKIQTCLKKDSFLARFDGGHFAIVLSETSKKQIIHLLDKINLSLEEPFNIQNYKIHAKLIFGVRSFCVDGFDYQKIVKDAEIALGYAKAYSANQIAYFDAAMEQQYLRKLLIENDLQQAFNTSQFYLVYQPFISLHDRSIVGVEALVRWNHPKLHEISPAEFIPLAEKTGKIIELGYWILNQAFFDIKSLLRKKKNYQQFIFSINLSPEQLLAPEFFDELKKLIDIYKIPTQILQFEITETKLLQNIKNVIVVLDRIKKIGCKIAIDDFGTGHSSLERLRELPVSVIKIDKCFVDKVDTSERSTALVKHILMLANELGLKTIAEGIENEQQEHMLRFLGCAIGQGFYYSKPILLPQLEKKYLQYLHNGSFVKNLRD